MQLSLMMERNTIAYGAGQFESDFWRAAVNNYLTRKKLQNNFTFRGCDHD